MSTEWYYALAGQKLGPIGSAELKSMAAAGTLAPTDLVWNQNLTTWVQAQRVEELGFTSTSASAATAIDLADAPAHQHASATLSPSSHDEPSTTMTTHAVLPYADSGAGAPVSVRSIEVLSQTRPWVLLLSILMFIGAGLLVVVALAMTLVGATRPTPFPAVLGAVYLGMSLLYIFPAIFLYRYARRISDLQRSGRAGDLEAALQAQKSFWKFMGILVTAVIGIYLVIFAIAVVGRVYWR